VTLLFPPLIDSHAHLDHADFDADRAEVFERARAVGVTSWVVPALTPASTRSLLESQWAGPDVHPAAGIHPHEVAGLDASALAEVDEILRTEPRVRAVGETGIDHYYGDETAIVKQRRFFEAHLEMGERHGLPVIVHVRDGNPAAAGAAMAPPVPPSTGAGAPRSAFREVLERIRGSRATGVLHSFTGSRAEAEAAIELGWFIGLGGILTFRSSESLRETARALPSDRILLETDAPYLAPVPRRGKRNEPAFLVHTLEALAALRNVSKLDMALLITSNARRLFRLT
jgi:TatD DNase family protein